MPDLRTTSLPELTAPADGDILEIVDVSDTTDDLAGTSKKIQRVNLVKNVEPDGWSTAGQTFVYAAVQQITITGVDMTSTLQAGDKLKMTNDGSVKYYYIASISFSSDTTINLAGEVDLANSAITLPFYSKVESPQGFVDGRNQFTARAYLNGAQNLVNNSPTKITLDAESFDTNSDFSTSTNQLTIPVDGKYLVLFNMTVAQEVNVAFDFAGIVYNNSAIVLHGSRVHVTGSGASSISDNASSGGSLMAFAKGDLVELRGFQSSGATRAMTTGATKTFLSINFVSAV